MASIGTNQPKCANDYKSIALEAEPELDYITIEVVQSKSD